MICPQPFVYRYLAIVLLLAATLPAAATTIHVPADKPTIQAAIDAASNGDTILVSDGTYMENIDFKGKAVTLKSVNGPSSTIIDGGKLDSVVKFVTGEGLSSILDGFTITNSNGVGVYILATSPTVKNNLITANSGCTGAGINIGDGSPLILSNTITNNFQSGCTGGTSSGGISVGGPPAGAQIIGNTISGNNGTLGTGAGGISLFAVGPVLIKNNFISNNLGYEGGGIGARSLTPSVQIIQNVITGNSAADGGGIEIDNSVALVLNNSVFGNDAPTGSALYAHFSNANGAMTMSNNLFIGKSGQPAIGCRGYDTTNSPVFSFNDAFTAGGPNYGGGCVAQTGSNGNVSVDPFFVNPGSDFHLQSTSPVIDAGSNSAPSLPQQDIASSDRILDGNGDCVATVDMGAYEFARPSSLTLSPASLSFPDQVVGSISAALPSTITNNASKPSNVCSIAVSGDFSQTNTCGSAIVPKSSCAVNVTFTPTAHGTRSGLLQIITNDAGSPQSIVLSGKGVIPAVVLSITSLNFSPQQVGTTSTSQSVTLNNTGDGPLSITNVAMTGDFSQTNTCGNTVAPGNTCSFSVIFAPTASGNRTGTLTITDNAAGNPHAVSLTGSASDFVLAAATGGSTSATVTAGSPAKYNLQVTPQNGFNAAVALSCTGAPSEATCTVSQPSVTPNGSPAPFTVSVTTTAPSLILPQAPTPRVPPLGFFPVAMLLLSVIALYLRSLNSTGAFCPRRISYRSPIVILVLSAIAIAGCGGGSSTPKDPGTPKGAHTVTVTGTSNGVSHTLNLTLNVN